MSHHDLMIFCLSLALMLVAALIFGRLSRRIGQPAVLGELIGGILIGPTLLGAFFPGFQTWLFPPAGPASAARDAVVKLGLIFFLFVAGFEMDIRHLEKKGGTVALVSFLGILIPFGLGYGATMFLPRFFPGNPITGNVCTPLFMGTALSISALPVISRTLMDMGLFKTEWGSVVVAAATLDDLIGWFLFAIILSAYMPAAHEVSPGKMAGLVLAFFIFCLTVGRRLGPRFLAWLKTSLPWPSGFIGISAILVLLAAAFAEYIGIHAVFGAFLVGLSLAPSRDSDGDHEMHETVYSFVTSFFGAPVYFVSIGLKADFAANFDLWLVLFVLLIACAGKIMGAGLGARLGGMSFKKSMATGFAMNSRGAMEMILASLALEAGLIDKKMFVALVVMALVTSVLSGPMIRKFLDEAPAV